MQDLLRVLPVLVVPGIGPRVVGRVAGFPEAAVVLQGHFHVAETLVVAHAMADARAEHGLGLLLSNKFRQRLDVLHRHVARSIEPDVGEFTVVRADLVHLRIALLLEILIKRSG